MPWNDKVYFALAVMLYGVSMIYSIFLWRDGFRRNNPANYILLAAGLVLHTIAMTQRGFTLERCPINNLYEATAFIMWTAVLAYLALGAWHRLRFLGAFISPVLFGMGIFALMPALDPPHGPKPDFSGALASLHKALLLLSFGGFGLSAAAATMYLMQEHDLRFHKLRAISSLMPSLQRLEVAIERLLQAGFVLLTAGLVASVAYLKQKTNAYFSADPEVVWAFGIWLFYLVLLVLHLRHQQTGRRFAWSALASFLFVLLTFWGVYLLSPLHQG